MLGIVVIHRLPIHHNLVADVALLHPPTEMRIALRKKSILLHKRYPQTFWLVFHRAVVGQWLPGRYRRAVAN